MSELEKLCDELMHMSRPELLKLFLLASEEIKKLQKENAKLKDELKELKFRLEGLEK